MESYRSSPNYYFAHMTSVVWDDTCKIQKQCCDCRTMLFAPSMNFQKDLNNVDRWHSRPDKIKNEFCFDLKHSRSKHYLSKALLYLVSWILIPKCSLQGMLRFWTWYLTMETLDFLDLGKLFTVNSRHYYSISHQLVKGRENAEDSST